MDAWTKELAKREPEAAQVIAECEAELRTLTTSNAVTIPLLQLSPDQ